MALDITLTDRVVEIIARRGTVGRPSWSVGSGFVMRDSIVLTAAHVVEGAAELLARFRGATERVARVFQLPDGTLALDADTDLAIVELIEASAYAGVALALIREDPTLGTPNIDQ